MKKIVLAYSGGLDTSIISNIVIEDQLEKSRSFEEEDEIVGYDMEQICVRNLYPSAGI